MHRQEPVHFFDWGDIPYAMHQSVDQEDSPAMS